MRSHRRTANPMLLLTVVLLLGQATLADTPGGVNRQLIQAMALPNVPGNNLTVVSIELEPGTSVPVHEHEAFVFVYVLEGSVRSQLGDGEKINYSVGESWIEPPGVLHSLTENISKTDRAKFIAVFVARDGARLTTSGKIGL